MLSLDEIIKHVESVAYNNSDKSLICMGIKEYRELAELLQELQDRRKADSCEGCVKEFGKTYLLVCASCKRRYADLYEPERRTDGQRTDGQRTGD